MLHVLIECAIRATLIWAATAVLLRVLCIQTASARHVAWTGVVVLMFLLPAWTVWGPKASIPVLPVNQQTTAGPEALADWLVTPAPSSATHPVAIPSSLWSWQQSWFAIYLLGVFVLLARLIIGTIRACNLMSTAVRDGGVLVNARCNAPVTVGWFRPVVILPENWRSWPRAELDAVLAHEREHAGRRHSLWQWLALLNRALFWFHPLAWWLEKRLSSLAEETCDFAVLARGVNPHDYCESLIRFASAVATGGHRIQVSGVALPRGLLERRITRILSGSMPSRVSPARMAALVTGFAITALTFAAGSLAFQKTLAAQSGPSPTFEVASIRPGDQNGRGQFQLLPGGTVVLRAVNLRLLIQEAYDVREFQISGGPSWMKSERYDITAKPSEAGKKSPGSAVDLMRLRLQALLADRFQLKFHRETRELPVYAMVVAKNGPKLTQDQLPAGGQMRLLRGRGQLKGQGTDMRLLALALSRQLDRTVIDQTGLKGTYDFELKWTPDLPSTSPPTTPDQAQPIQQQGPSIFTAIQEQFGLKLEAGKGPVEVLIIDHAEKASEN